MKKKLSLILVLALLAITVFTGCGGDEPTAEPEQQREAVEINVSAAASLTDALDEIITAYGEVCDDTITPNYGGSGALVTQVQEGAPCDLFISAATKNMDDLEAAELIDTATRVDILENKLTLIASAEKADSVTYENFKDCAYIAVGQPEDVPAGKYATQVFESLGLSVADMEAAGKIVYAKDVRAVLDYVDSGNADCGFVYRTDAMLLQTGKVICDTPDDSHDAVLYPAAVIAGSEKADAAAEFLAFIQGDEAKAIFEKYGFTVL